jgi:hypothetical protein
MIHDDTCRRKQGREAYALDRLPARNTKLDVVGSRPTKGEESVQEGHMWHMVAQITKDPLKA